MPRFIPSITELGSSCVGRVTIEGIPVFEFSAEEPATKTKEPVAARPLKFEMEKAVKEVSLLNFKFSSPTTEPSTIDKSKPTFGKGFFSKK